MSAAPDAFFALALHAHLPFVHHPEHPAFLEEDWYFEAVTETYVPLIESWQRLCRSRVPFRVTISLTPTLLEMMANPLLQERYEVYLTRRMDLASMESRNRRRPQAERELAGFYLRRFRAVREVFVKIYRGDLIRAFREFQESGHLEVMGSAATHGLLPLMATPNAIRAQIEVGLSTAERHLGRRPRGFWLPECAFKPGIDEVLSRQKVEYVIVDTHGLLNGFPVPAAGVHAPIRCPSGLAVFARDLESSKQVWSSEEGYPGDGAYREFYRDLGYDAAYDDIRPYLHSDGVRRSVGIKYHRVTGRVDLSMKALYDRNQALARAREHGDHFIACRRRQLRFLKAHIQEAPIVVSPYDAELFGHWWYEGPEFLERAFRAAAKARDSFQVCTLSEYLGLHPPRLTSTPSSSSWGDKGYFEVWLNGSNDWIYRHLHKAEKRMVELAQAAAGARPGQTMRKALNQAARELLLAQSSDWAFLMTSGTTAPYAERRTRDHLHRFTRLYTMLRSGHVDAGEVSRLHRLSPIFPEIDYRVYL